MSGESKQLELRAAENEKTDCTSFKDLFANLCQALEFTESEHDEHADFIKQVWNTPGFDVNRREEWEGWPRGRQAALHVATLPTLLFC